MFDWALAGPSCFVAGLAEVARTRGLAALITPPHMPDGIEGALAIALSTTHDHLIPIGADGPRFPVEALGEALGLSLPSARRLRPAREALGKALLIRGTDPVDAARWDPVLRAYLSGCSEPASRFHPVLILVVSPAWSEMLIRAGVPIVEWRGVVTRTDATRVALDRIGRGRDPLLDRLAVETAVAIGGWDLARVGEEASRRASSLDALLAPPEPPARPNGSAPPPEWERGVVDSFDGRPFVHPAVAPLDALRHRLWRAQVTVLFGWLEEMRLDFVAEVEPWLRGLPGDPRDHEWAALASFLRDDKRLGAFPEACRRLRNSLAHGDPITNAAFSPVLSRAQRKRRAGSS